MRTNASVVVGLLIAALVVLSLVGCPQVMQELPTPLDQLASQDPQNTPASLVKVSFVLTDAPVDDEKVDAVNVTVSGVRVNESADAESGEGTWRDIVVDPPVSVDLLELRNGVTVPIGSTELPGGIQINQIRLVVEAVEVVYDGVAHEATMSSGDTTGLKIVKAFDVPLFGEITIAVDFDARKSIVMTGPPPDPSFKVKPVLRAVVEGEAGSISGAGPAGRVVHAYRPAEWSPTEKPEYLAAYTSAALSDPDADGVFTYRLAFLEPGWYTLVLVDLAGIVDDVVVDDVEVIAGRTTEYNFPY